MTHKSITFLALHGFIYIWNNFSHVGSTNYIELEEEAEDRYTFVVSIQDRSYPNHIKNPERSHICSGTLVSYRHVLTAAHCLQSERKLKYLEVLVGSPNLKNSKSYYPQLWISYAHWAKKTNKVVKFDENDVAIMMLSSEVDEKNVIPAVLSKKKTSETYGFNGFAAGWGSVNDVEAAESMQKAQVTVVGNGMCQEYYKDVTGLRKEDAEIYTCTISTSHELLSSGESGGPMYYKGNILLGVNTGLWTKTSDGSRVVSIYAAIDHLRTFIKEAIKIDDENKCLVAVYWCLASSS
ncbi:hypothetical protein QAD02_001502 [Eretmocerus hayati]|uniref:Uncharacterized protein n=1 Tax=Eretmocerus hayati TaxID=131215 RepID=A0ACC2NH64_9HYME|nr:hypothetical protein QAD02_001502 [Eretmocerus hayati]